MNNCKDVDKKLSRPGLRYFMAMVICLAFYFPLTMLSVSSVQTALGILMPVSIRQSVFPELFPIVWRTLLAYIGIGISLRFLLKIPILKHIKILYKDRGRFMITVLVFTVLLLAREQFIAVFYGYKLVTNTAAFVPDQVNTTLALLLFSVIIIPIHALAEECIYRAFPIKGIYQAGGNVIIAIAVSAILFWLNHGGQMILYWLPISVLLGVLVVYSRSITHTWAIHTAFNFYNASMVNNAAGGTDAPLTMLIRTGSASDLAMRASDVACVLIISMLLLYGYRNKKRIHLDKNKAR